MHFASMEQFRSRRKLLRANVLSRWLVNNLPSTPYSKDLSGTSESLAGEKGKPE